MASLYDVINANKYSAKENPYGIGALSIASAIPGLYNPYASTGSNLGYTLGSSLLAGLLGGVANKRAQRENTNLYTQALNMQGMTSPEQMMQAAGNNDRLQAVATSLIGNRQDRQAELSDYQTKSLIGMNTDITKEQLIRQAQEAAERKKWEAFSNPGVVSEATQPNDSYALDPVTADIQFSGEPQQVGEFTAPEVGRDLTSALTPPTVEQAQTPQVQQEPVGQRFHPDDPRYKIQQDKIDNERQLGKDFEAMAKEFQYKVQTMEALKQAFEDPAGTSDYELIRRGSQMVEPGLAVRRDDEESLQSAASVLGLSLATVKNAMSAESKLDPEVRKGILRMAERSLNSSLNNYNIQRKKFIGMAQAGGLNPEFVVPYPEATPVKLGDEFQFGANSEALKANKARQAEIMRQLQELQD